ncbi:MAG TPA: ABC transporter substrate-binding protein [Acidimicrobiia bacterium]|nr:ABC transporter substrate-binding protein [Acidimicrobiia bacterium]
MIKRVTLLIAVFSVVAAACGESGAPDTTAPGADDTTTAPTTAPTTTPDTTAATTPDTTATTAAVGDECAVENLELVSPGELTVATGEPAFPPWVIDDDPTNQQGFESAVVYAVAEEMGFSADQVTWTRVGFDEAIAPGPKDFDLNIQQYSITDERDEVVDFTVPYYVTQQALVAFADSEIADATSIEDLRSYALGAQIGTTSLDYIEEVIQPETQAAVYDTNADAKSALDAGQIDAIVFDLPTAYFITAVEMTDTSIVGALPASEDQADRFGMMLEEGNPLKACVDQALEALRSDGTLDALAEEWLAQESDIPILSE